MSKEEIIGYDLILAEMQLMGFGHAKSGHSIESLVQGMGLTKDEWEELKIQKRTGFIKDPEIESIDKHFKK